jgi:hypothetical protein
MTEISKKEINKSAGKIEDIACASCERVTKHEVLASVDVRGSDGPNEYSVDYGTHDQIIQCRGCETISFRSTSWNSEDVEWGPEGLEQNYVTHLYPSRSAGRTAIDHFYLLPLDVQRIYSETIKAMNNEQPVLAGVGIRAIVEGICRDKKAEGKDLFFKINSLVALGVLTTDGAVILHKVRSLGNKAAHEVKPHSTEQLALALDVCEHLFSGVYILPHQAKSTFTE